jgi:thymidylate synthase
MSTPPRFNNATAAWQHQLEYVLEHGHEINPRGKPTVEVQRPSLRINMNRPNVCVKPRKLGYSFMAAEALWMIRGDDTVDGIATWNSNIAQFSDDGETFFGAYGPKIVGQSDYVVDKLIQDPNTRQAVLTIWRENPPESNDIPCTVSMDFKIRDRQLHCHVYMRSSDTYLGLPYDIFNFSMVSAWIAARHNERVADDKKVLLGDLFWSASSSHIYKDPENFPYDLDDVRECIEAENLHENSGFLTPHVNIRFTNSMDGFRELRQCLIDARADIERQYANSFTPRFRQFDPAVSLEVSASDTK